MTDLRKAAEMALEALLHMCNTTKAQNDYNAKIVDKALVALEAALAQPEQESKPIYVMGNYAGEGKVVSASFGLPKGAFEFAPHTGKGEASKIKHSLEPMPVAKHVCNLWINPETSFYEVDRCTHPINEVFPVYTAPPKPEQEPCGWQFFQDGQWHNGSMLNNHRQNTEDAGYEVRDVYPPPLKPDAWLSGEGLELKQVLVKQNGNWVETPFSVGQPRKAWVSLSDTEINKIVDLNTSDDDGFDIWCDGFAVAHIVCAKLKELNK